MVIMVTAVAIAVAAGVSVAGMCTTYEASSRP